MKKILVIMMFALPSLAWAAKPNPADYTLEAHVRETETVYACNDSIFGNPTGCGMRLLIIAVIDGRKFQLRANTSNLLRLGDYKVKEKKREDSDPVVPSYIDQRAYEMLLPDSKTMTFQVVGETED